MREKGGDSIKNLRKMRKDRQISQTQLAIILGMKSNTLSQYELNKRSPKIETLKKIAEALDCTVDELIREE